MVTGSRPKRTGGSFRRIPISERGSRPEGPGRRHSRSSRLWNRRAFLHQDVLAVREEIRMGKFRASSFAMASLSALAFTFGGAESASAFGHHGSSGSSGSSGSHGSSGSSGSHGLSGLFGSHGSS